MSQTLSFTAETAHVHDDHVLLFSRLAALDRALDELACYSEVYANLAPAGDIGRATRELAEALPNHFGTEESGLFEVAEDMGPKMAQFAQAMRNQHAVLRVEFDQFYDAVIRLENFVDLLDAVCAVKERGQMFARHMRAHMTAEETTFAKLAQA
jgi:hypothetical protein